MRDIDILKILDSNPSLGLTSTQALAFGRALLAEEKTKTAEWVDFSIEAIASIPQSHGGIGGMVLFTKTTGALTRRWSSVISGGGTWAHDYDGITRKLTDIKPDAWMVIPSDHKYYMRLPENRADSVSVMVAPRRKL